MLPYLKIQEAYFMSTSKPPLPNVEGGGNERACGVYIAFSFEARP